MSQAQPPSHLASPTGGQKGSEQEAGAQKALRLLEILKLEKIEENMFRGNNELPRQVGVAAAGLPPVTRLFGGQVLSQALQAAYQTVQESEPSVAPGLDFHSLHGYFLKAGTSALPVLYEVDRIRDGRSFTTRRVVAIQRGEAIFSMSASFHRPESGFEHAHSMPNVPPPEELRDDLEVAQEFAPDDPAVRGLLSPMALHPRAFRTRSVFPIGSQGWRKQRRWNPVWLKLRTELPQLSDADADPHANSHGRRILQHTLLAYASDMGLVSTAVMPLNTQSQPRQWQLASLDHALWLHRPDLVDDWLLLHKHTSVAEGSRGLVHAEFFDRTGLLVASVTQEGLMRQARGS